MTFKNWLKKYITENYDDIGLNNEQIQKVVDRITRSDYLLETIDNEICDTMDGLGYLDDFYKKYEKNNA